MLRTHRKRSRISGLKGFALVEVLVSAALFAIGILGLVALQARSIQFSSDAEDRSKAALFANDLASYMWTDKSLDVTTGQLYTDYTNWLSRLQTVSPGCTSCLANSAANVQVLTDATTSTKYALITILWKAPNKGSTASCSLSTTTDCNQYVTEVRL